MSAETLTAPNTTPTGVLLRVLGIVSAICGLIIVGSYEVTLPAVNANRRLALERAVFKVVPTAKSIVEYYALPAGGIEPAKSGGGDAPAGVAKFYAAYDDAGKLTGIAAEAGAKGYADTVRIMFGYESECQCIKGIGVVSMKETPGIGDKILTDKEFLANFKSLDVKLKEDLQGLANEVKTVKHGTKTNPWQIDAIAGATVTSRAVGKGINDAAQFLLPKLAPNLEKLKVKS
ncbi:MAG TPA: FMN-binding protein [Rhodocyclaceae bacterium]|nr:FMN-binding protein [Rhodocyclaceae bacterium]